MLAFDEEGRPSFNALQNYGSSPAPVVYYVFDVMVLAGRDLRRESLETRRELLEKKVLPKLAEPVRYSAPLDADLPVLIQSVKAHGFEGLVAKRRTSVYEPGLRTGAWMKMRVNRGQEFVIGGYTPSDMPLAFHGNGTAAMYHALMRGERGQIAEFDVVNAADWSGGRDKSAFPTIRVQPHEQCADE